MRKIAISLFFILMALPVGAHFYSSDFEAYTVGNLIEDESPTWWHSDFPADATVEVDPADSQNQVLEVSTGTSSSRDDWLLIDGISHQPSDRFIIIDYDLYLSSDQVRSLTFGMVDNNTSDTIYVAFGVGGPDTIGYGTGAGWITQSYDFNAGTWMHTKWILDQVSNTYDLYINSGLVLNDIPCWNDPITTERAVFYNSSNVRTLVDNIIVTVSDTDPNPDVDPPTPLIAAFSSPPSALSDTEITMTAALGTDPSGPVEYYFVETTSNPGATNSIWQTSRTYTDSGLTPQTLYTYTVQMRDSLGNTGTVSSPASATTQSPADKSPDLYVDGKIDSKDASILLGQWLFQGQGLESDLNNSEQVDFIDFEILAAAFGQTKIYIDSVPDKAIEDAYDGGYDVTIKPEDIVTKGPWVDVGAYPSFASAISELTTDGNTRTLLIIDEQNVVADVNVPEFITLGFVGGGVLDVDGNKTVTIAGPIQSEAAKIFDGSGNIIFSSCSPGGRKVYPEWWGAKGDNNTDDTDAIQAAIDSLGSYGGVVYFRPGAYQNTGITLTSNVCLRGSHRGVVSLMYKAASGSCVTLANNCKWGRIENLNIRNDYSTAGGYGVDGRNGYIENFAMENFAVSRFQYGICVEEGKNITIDTGYIVCYGGGTANGTIGLKLGDYDSGYIVNSATVKDMYFTMAEIDFYNNALPCTIIRPIFEFAQYAMENHSRSVLMAPFMAAVPPSEGSYNLKIEDNGMLFLGTANAEDGFDFGSGGAEDRTSWIPDTFDSPMKLGTLGMNQQGNFDKFLGKKWTKGTVVPTSGTWSQGDICWNTSPSAGGTLFWACTSGGTPGMWKAFKIEN